MSKSKAQEVFEAVNDLVEKGSTKADAFRQLAKQLGQPVDSVRGSYYGYKRKTEGGSKPRRSRRRETTPADAVESAVETLRRSIDLIDVEVEAAKERWDEAAREYEQLKNSAEEKKALIEAKITALQSDQ